MWGEIAEKVIRILTKSVARFIIIFDMIVYFMNEVLLHVNIQT